MIGWARWVDMVMSRPQPAPVLSSPMSPTFLSSSRPCPVLLLGCGSDENHEPHGLGNNGGPGGRYHHTPRLMGQTLGLFAYGNVARCTARRAKAFGLHVIATTYVGELTFSGRCGAGESGQLLTRSDFVSVHAPHNEELITHSPPTRSPK